jgi:hypothetical protein
MMRRWGARESFFGGRPVDASRVIAAQECARPIPTGDAGLNRFFKLWLRPIADSTRRCNGLLKAVVLSYGGRLATLCSGLPACC